MVTLIQVGEKYGNLFVLREISEKHVEPSGKAKRILFVRCDCGYEFCTQSVYIARKLKSGNIRCKACANLKRSIIKIGDVFDELTVIDFRKIGKRRFAICKCSCGNEVKVRPSLLPYNITNNCGCKPRGRWGGIQELSKTYFNRLKRGAAIRNLEFNITIEYVWDLYIKQDKKCALSNLPLSFSLHVAKPNEASLDRIDSKLGYIEGNVQWVHKDVNLMKMDIDQDRFIEICSLIAANKGKQHG